MRLLRTSLHRRRVGRPLFVVATLAVLAMPVDYRGGAPEPHPHASLQLWLDAAAGSTDHHHPWDAHRHRAGDHRHEWSVHPSHPSPHRHTFPTLPSAATDGPDVPKLSAMTSSIERAMAVAVVGGWSPLVPLVRARLAAEVVGTLVGLLLAPDPPPPRRPVPVS